MHLFRTRSYPHFTTLIRIAKIYSFQDLIFLMIGGEGEEPPKWSGDPTVQIMQYAALFGATVFDLEHRFFGDSRPMKWLIEFDKHTFCRWKVLSSRFLSSMFLHLKNDLESVFLQKVIGKMNSAVIALRFNHVYQEGMWGPVFHLDSNFFIPEWFDISKWIKMMMMMIMTQFAGTWPPLPFVCSPLNRHSLTALTSLQQWTRNMATRTPSGSRLEDLTRVSEKWSNKQHWSVNPTWRCCRIFRYILLTTFVQMKWCLTGIEIRRREACVKCSWWRGLIITSRYRYRSLIQLLRNPLYVIFQSFSTDERFLNDDRRLGK